MSVGPLWRGASIIAVSATVLLGSCGGGVGTSPNPTATKVAFTQAPTSTALGSVGAPAVKVAVQGSGGTTITSATDPITIVLGSSPAGGTLSGTTMANAVNGVATFSDLSISAAGAGYTLVASSGTLTSATSGTFNVFGPAAQIAKNAGDNQTAAVSTAVSTPPSVIVRDAANVPVPNAGVTFAVASGGGNASPASPVSTGQGGIAAVTSWTLGPIAGPNTLTATAAGLTGSPLTFSATGENVVIISVINNQFVPKNPPPVPVGTKVRWVWASPSGPHTVTPDATELPRDPISGTASNPHTYEHTFNTPGIFAYFCEVHGGAGGFGMAGTITVQ